MAVRTAAGLVTFAKDKLGTEYVYGMKGAVLTEAKYNALKKQYRSLVWASDRNKIGKVCVDCSGLISWYTGKVINSTAYRNTATRVLPISEIVQAVPGCAVWRSGHIGVYIGNGEIIEARGSAYGVVKTKVSTRDFTHVLWLTDIDYSAAEKPQKQPSKPAKGDTVYTVQKGDTLSAIAKKYGTDYKTLAEYNGIDNPNKIYGGQEIRIPSAGGKPDSYYPKCTYSGTSIVDALKSMGIDSSYSYRAQIAAANDIKGYQGTPQQNSQMLSLLKTGKLKKA